MDPKPRLHAVYGGVRRFGAGTTVAEIQQANAMPSDAHNLIVGKVLTVPTKEGIRYDCRGHALNITIPNYRMPLMSHPKASPDCHVRVASHALRTTYAWSFMSQVLNVTPWRYDGGGDIKGMPPVAMNTRTDAALFPSTNPTAVLAGLDMDSEPLLSHSATGEFNSPPKYLPGPRVQSCAPTDSVAPTPQPRHPSHPAPAPLSSPSKVF
eukprot:1468612-Pyramimonas_sp.AAC.1